MSGEIKENTYLVKEHVGMFKAASNYDIYDPSTGAVAMECREERLGALTKILRFTEWKRNTPFDIRVRTPDGRQIVRIKRGFSLFLSKGTILNGQDEVIGGFQQQIFSIGGAFTILDPSSRPVCQLKGKWTAWNYKFMAGETELAHITNKWSGVGKELFTSADNYILQISESVPVDSVARQLIIAAVMCIDMVLKE